MHVYRALLDRPDDDLLRIRNELPSDERAWLADGGSAGDGSRALTARALLRVLLGGLLEVDPLEVRLTGADGERPRLDGAADGSAVRFDYARAGSCVLYAFTRRCRVGLSVASLQPIEDLEARARDFSTVERETLLRLPPGLRAEGFHQCSVRKRALLAAGDGDLSCSMADFDVSLTPGVPPRVYRWRAGADRPEDVTLHHLRPGPECVGAAAVLSRIPHLKMWTWQG